MVKVNLKARGKRIAKLPATLDITASDTVESAKMLISKSTGLSTSRLRLTVASSDGKKKDTVLNDSDKLASAAGDATVNVKDLGPQIGWRTVFLLEYLGPLLIHPFFYYCQSFVYGEKFEHTKDQKYLFWFVILHFVKREFETAFVHQFSLSTMPLFNLFKNSGHYWILSGVFLGYFNYAPESFSNILFQRQFMFPIDEQLLRLIAGVWVFAELSNFKCHLTTAALRADGSKERKIPYGYGFRLISFPNYYFESLAWLTFSVISQNWSSWLFFGVSTGQMLIWAVKKHRRYRKDFPNYPKNRKAMIPFLL